MLFVLFVSNSGTALQIAAQAWFMWERTHDPRLLGLLGLVQATPLLGVPLLGGMLADAWPRRSLLLITQPLLAAIAASMGIVALWGTLSPGLLLLLAGLLSTVMALDNPVRQVYLPGVVHGSRRGRIVGLNALSYNAGVVVGPALAGLLLPVAGAGWCFLANSVSYVLVAAWLVRGPEGRLLSGIASAAAAAAIVDTIDAVGRASAADRGSKIDVNKGMRGAGSYVLHSPNTLVMLALVGALSFLGRSYVHVLPALVNMNWGGGAIAYGTLAALPGVGAVLAAGLTVWFLGRQASQDRTYPARPITIGALLLGLTIVALGLSQALIVAGATLVIVGFAATGTMTLLNAALQSSTPDVVRGRVLSLYTVLAAGMPALGGWVLGTVMYATAPPVALVTAGLTLGLLAVLLGQWLLRAPVTQESQRSDES